MKSKFHNYPIYNSNYSTKQYKKSIIQIIFAKSLIKVYNKNDVFFTHLNKRRLIYELQTMHRHT